MDLEFSRIFILLKLLTLLMLSFRRCRKCPMSLSFTVVPWLIIKWESRYSGDRDGKLFNQLLFFQLNNYKNIEDGTVGRILSYNDLSDRRERTKKKNSEDESEEDEEEEEHRRLQEEMERKV